jgi:hypothetical protein
MIWIGQAIAFAALVAGTAYLEVHNKPQGELWIVIIFWIILADWHPKNKD